DGTSFFELTTIQGAGNSNTLLTYSAVDNKPTGTVYYRLKQVDFDGTTEYHQIVSASCVDAERFTVNNLVLLNTNLGFSITAKQEEDIAIYFYDYRGRMISNKVQQIESGNNLIELNNLKLSTGIYMLYIIGDKNNYSTKLMSKRN
ncbi:MAG: T9SS type A sorting domain-containing protein, partial [Vicingaceae bacterium]